MIINNSDKFVTDEKKPIFVNMKKYYNILLGIKEDVE